MTMAETLTMDSFKGLHRFKLMQIAKKLGMDRDEAMKTNTEQLKDWILENQEGGSSSGGDDGGNDGAKGGTKSSKKSTRKSAKSTETESTSSGRRVARGAKARKVREEADNDDDNGDTSGSTEDLVDVISELKDKICGLEEKIDVIGEIVDKNMSPIVTEMQELRADNYVCKGLLAHMYRNMESDELVNPESAPDGLGCDDKLEQLEEEVSEGNG